MDGTKAPATLDQLHVSAALWVATCCCCCFCCRRRRLDTLTQHPFSFLFGVRQAYGTFARNFSGCAVD